MKFDPEKQGLKPLRRQRKGFFVRLSRRSQAEWTKEVSKIGN
jgi:hypothetical protein